MAHHVKNERVPWLANHVSAVCVPWKTFLEDNLFDGLWLRTWLIGNEVVVANAHSASNVSYQCMYRPTCPASNISYAASPLGFGVADLNGFKFMLSMHICWHFQQNIVRPFVSWIFKQILPWTMVDSTKIRTLFVQQSNAISYTISIFQCDLLCISTISFPISIFQCNLLCVSFCIFTKLQQSTLGTLWSHTSGN
jgi:hypothetical protein